MKPVPILSTLRSANVATPATAVTVLVPESVDPAVPVPPTSATVTLPTNPDSTAPRESFAVTTTAGVMTPPAGDAAAGCTVNSSRSPAVMSNAALVVPVSPEAAAVSV